MVDWLTIAGMLGGMGQFASGIADFWPGSTMDITSQQKNQYQYLRNYPAHLRIGAESAGFHPLAMLGINPGSGGSYRAFSGQNIGRGLRKMGQGLEDMMTGRSDLEKAKAEYFKAMADDIRKKQPQTDTSGPVIEGQYDVDPQSPQVGVMPKVSMMEQPFVEKDPMDPKSGWLRYLVNREAAESLETEWGENTDYNIRKYMNRKTIIHAARRPYTREGIEFNKALRVVRRHLPKLEKGYMYKMDASRQQWKIVKGSDMRQLWLQSWVPDDIKIEEYYREHREWLNRFRNWYQRTR